MKHIVLFVFLCHFFGSIEALGLGGKTPQTGWVPPRVPGQRVISQPPLPPATPATFAPGGIAEPGLRTPFVQAPTQLPEKLIIDLYNPEKPVFRIVKDLHRFVLTADFTIASVKTTVVFPIAELEQEENASYWIALLYLQQIGSAYVIQQNLEIALEAQGTKREKRKENKEYAELNDIIIFHYINEHIKTLAPDKKPLYFDALIKAMEYVVDQSNSGWQRFLRDTSVVSITIKKVTSKEAINGIRLSRELLAALTQVNKKSDVVKAKTELETELKRGQKEIVKGQKKLEGKVPGAIPVPVPVPIRGEKIEQAVSELKKPVPPAPPAPVIPPPAPQPQPAAEAVPMPIAPEVPVAPAPMPEVTPAPQVVEEQPAPPNLPVLVETPETTQKKGKEWYAQGIVYQRELRTARTAQEAQALLDKLQDKKELYPDLVERVEEKLATLKQEEERAKGMQLVPYTGKTPEQAKEEAKPPRVTLTPEGAALLEQQKQPERWQQEMMEEQARMRRLNEQLNEQLLAQLETPAAPAVTAPAPIELAPPIVRPTVAPTPVVTQPPPPPPAPAQPVFPRPGQIAQAFTRPAGPRTRPTVVPPTTPTQMPAPTAPVTPMPAPAVPVPTAHVPVTPPVPLLAPVPVNVVAQLEQLVKRLDQMFLPVIKDSTIAADTTAVARFFLTQALEAFPWYEQYQPQMPRQAVLMALHDYSNFSKQLKAAYERALSSSDAIGAAYFKAIEIATEGRETGWLGLRGTSLVATKDKDTFKNLKLRFAKDIEEAARFARMFEEAAKTGVLKQVWEFVTSMTVVIKGLIGATDEERQDAIKALTALLPLVDPKSSTYSDKIDKALHSAREILATKSVNKDQYKVFIKTYSRSVFEDIQSAIENLQGRLSGGKPLTIAEQYIREIPKLARQGDMQAATKLQEVAQLPPAEQQEVVQTLAKLNPDIKEKLTEIVAEQVEENIDAGNLQGAVQLAQQAQKLLPAQQQAIAAQVQPIIAKAQQKAQEAAKEAEKPVVVSQPEVVRPREVQGPVVALQPPAPRKITPFVITEEEKAFLKQIIKPVEQPISLSDVTIERVLLLFMHAIELNDEESIRLAVFAMKALMDQLKKLKSAALKQLNPVKIDQLRKLWEEQGQARAVAYLASGEQFIALTMRTKRLEELERAMDLAPSVQELHNMVPELQMMIDLGQKNRSAAAIRRRAQDLYDRVMRRLDTFTRWVPTGR